ncbi:MAG: hypothetical protein QXJ06_02045 [Candidatus Aenigmatarchaeota archaeon]
MMKVKISRDYWTLFNSNFDFSQLSDDEIDFIKTYKNGEVVSMHDFEKYNKLFEYGIVEFYYESFTSLLEDIFSLLEKVFEKYIDSTNENRKIWCLWVIASKFYYEFPTFPYLLLNATKRSGKSRLLKLTSFISDGIYTTNLTEAVLFRTKKPLFIDEAENLDAKEKKSLNELLNFAYKRGGKILRVEKLKTKKQEKFYTKEFDCYKPICLANISGLGDVLNDRCITLYLKRSTDPLITKRLEFFELDKDIIKVKIMLNLKDTSQIKTLMLDLYNFLNNNISDYTNELSRKIISLFNTTQLHGREFEIWLPLLSIAGLISEDLMEEIHKIAVQNQNDRAIFDILENTDIKILEVLNENFNNNTYYSVKDILKKTQEKENIGFWLNEKWLGRFLKRTQIIKAKRRLGRGIEVILDFDKIRELLNIYYLQNTQTTENTQTTQDSEVSEKSEVSEVKKENNEQFKEEQQNEIRKKINQIFTLYGTSKVPFSEIRSSLDEKEIQRALDRGLIFLDDEKKWAFKMES